MYKRQGVGRAEAQRPDQATLQDGNDSAAGGPRVPGTAVFPQGGRGLLVDVQRRLGVWPQDLLILPVAQGPGCLLYTSRCV